jgi:F-type H+-transporting ATPase subunit a
MFSPLEQFEFSLIVQTFFLDMTNYVLFLFLVAFGIMVVFLSGYKFLKKNSIIPKKNNYFLELTFYFIIDILRQQVGIKGLKFFPIFLYIFIFFLVSNITGLFPFSFTTTSHIIQNIFLTLSFMIGITIIGFERLGYKFFYIFIPSGVPLFLLPLISLIEIISYISRAFSLAIRLFANMMAGHSLLHIVSNFVIKLALLHFLISFVPSLLIIGVLLLEIGISFLQSYVLTVLLAIYLRDGFIAHH